MSSSGSDRRQRPESTLDTILGDFTLEYSKSYENPFTNESCYLISKSSYSFDSEVLNCALPPSSPIPANRFDIESSPHRESTDSKSGIEVVDADEESPRSLKFSQAVEELLCYVKAKIGKEKPTEDEQLHELKSLSREEAARVLLEYLKLRARPEREKETTVESSHVDPSSGDEKAEKVMAKIGEEKLTEDEQLHELKSLSGEEAAWIILEYLNQKLRARPEREKETTCAQVESSHVVPSCGHEEAEKVRAERGSQ